MAELQGAHPSHMQYENTWELAKDPDPDILLDYLKWLLAEPERSQSAVDSMQWLPPGFNTFLIAREAAEDGTTLRSLQLNLYHEDYPGNQDPHGHSRNARTIWYARPGTRQVISRYGVLGKRASRVEGIDVEERLVAGNCIIDLKDGRRPIYTPVELGSRLLVKQSVINVSPLSVQNFSSVEVHHIGFQGKGVAVSVHYKGPEESSDLSSVAGLVHYKHVSYEEAEELVRVRRGLETDGQLSSNTDARLGPITMLYRKGDNLGEIEALPVQTLQSIGEMLITGALHTAETLKRAA